MAKSSAQRAAKKAIKKMHPAYFAVIAIALIIGLAVGYVVGFVLYGKDTLELVGNKETTVAAGTTVEYEDEGIKYISSGKDMSAKYKIKDTNMALLDGKYVGTPVDGEEMYIVYEITEGRAKGQTLYRVFKVAGGEA